MQDQPTLYEYAPSGNCYKVRLLLHQLGLSFRREPVDITRGETRTAAFLARNPQGKIPVMRLAGGCHLPESHAILWYYAQGTSFIPDDPLAQAQVIRWLSFEQYQLEPFLGGLIYRLHSLNKSPEELGDDYGRLRDGTRSGLNVLNHHLASHVYLVGDQYSLADLALYAYTHQLDKAGFCEADFPAISRWIDRIVAQPDHIGIEQ